MEFTICRRTWAPRGISLANKLEVMAIARRMRGIVIDIFKLLHPEGVTAFFFLSTKDVANFQHYGVFAWFNRGIEFQAQEAANKTFRIKGGFVIGDGRSLGIHAGVLGPRN